MTDDNVFGHTSLETLFRDDVRDGVGGDEVCISVIIPRASGGGIKR